MTQADDLSRSLAAFDQNSTLIVVVEMSAANWLVAAMIPGVDRQPMKKLEPDPNALLQLLERWRAEAAKDGPDNWPCCPCPRGGPRRVLAGAVAACSRRRGACHSFDERRGVARAPSGEDRPTGHRHADASVPGLAARRAWPLRHGRNPDPR